MQTSTAPATIGFADLTENEAFDKRGIKVGNGYPFKGSAVIVLSISVDTQNAVVSQCDDCPPTTIPLTSLKIVDLQHIDRVLMVQWFVDAWAALAYHTQHNRRTDTLYEAVQYIERFVTPAM